MASLIVIDGLPPYDGRYPLDWNFTTRQYGWVKNLSGNLVDDMIDNMENGKADAELIMAWAVIALHQSAKIEPRDVPEVWEALIDAPLGSKVQLIPEVEESKEGEESDPPQPSSNSNDDTSGPDSQKSSETSDLTLDTSGMRGLVTSESESLRSVS